MGFGIICPGPNWRYLLVVKNSTPNRFVFRNPVISWSVTKGVSEYPEYRNPVIFRSKRSFYIKKSRHFPINVIICDISKRDEKSQVTERMNQEKLKKEEKEQRKTGKSTISGSYISNTPVVLVALLLVIPGVGARETVYCGDHALFHGTGC